MIERQHGVPLCQLKNLALCAALGGANLDTRATARGKQLAERLSFRLGELLLNNYLRRYTRPSRVVLGDELNGYLCAFHLSWVIEIERLPVGEDAIAHLEYLRVGVGSIGGDGDGVKRTGRFVDDALALKQ